MQSDGNSFCGDVVLDSFNMSYREEDSIVDQKYEKQIHILGSLCRFILLQVIKKMHIQRNTAHNNKELIKLCFSAVPWIWNV